MNVWQISVYKIPETYLKLRMATSLQSRSLAPGEARPYIIEPFGGETIYIPCTKAAIRLAVTAKESEQAFAIVTSGGVGGDPVGFHYHREAHEVFLCLKGKVNIWAGDQCRCLEPGDFASVPPNIVHQYQLLGDFTEGTCLIIPGGWEDFFRAIGDPYSGPMFPPSDNQNFFEVLEPRIRAAIQEHDMVPVPDHPFVEPQPWNDESDNVLPGALTPYFLQSGKGGRYLNGGVVVSPLITTAESDGKFSISFIEGSSWHEKGPLGDSLRFQNTHHALQVADGAIDVILDGKLGRLNVAEIAFIPRGTVFSVVFRSRYAKVYVYASGPSVADALREIGSPYTDTMVPEKASPWKTSALASLQETYNFELGRNVNIDIFGSLLQVTDRALE